jgi:hypothetical protein
MLQNLPEAFEVVSMTSGDQENMAPEVECLIRERIGKVHLSHLSRFRKPRPGCELRPVVQDPNL